MFPSLTITPPCLCSSRSYQHHQRIYPPRSDGISNVSPKVIFHCKRSRARTFQKFYSIVANFSAFLGDEIYTYHWLLAPGVCQAPPVCCKKFMHACEHDACMHVFHVCMNACARNACMHTCWRQVSVKYACTCT